MEKINVGIIGLGDRGIDLLDTLLLMDDVNVSMVCDLIPERIERSYGVIQKAGKQACKSTKDYGDMFKDPSIDAIVISTSWNNHVRLAMEAMKAGKYAAFEVGAAPNLEEPWQLVRTYEATHVPCMMLCNCDYGEKELAVLRMIRSGLFGEIVHLKGGYHHDMRRMADPKHLATDERAWHNVSRCGDLYPHHSLGPMMNYIDINRGNRMLSLVSMASKALNMNRRYQETREPGMPDLDFKMADVITTMIKCANGETILLTHDTCIARPYSRGNVVEGTKGVWMEELKSIHIEGVTEHEKWDADESYLGKYRHPLWRDKEKYKDWHHGGMDFITLRSFVCAVKNHVEPVIDAYDSATLLAIPVLTEMSIQQGSAPVAIPDFTSGKWLNRPKQFPNMYALDEIHEEKFLGDWTIE